MKKSSIYILLSGTLFLSYLLFQSCDKDDEVNQAPTCEITTPSSGEGCYRGEMLTISVTATDTDGNISKVEFFIDEVSKGSVSSSPYTYEWDTKNESTGDHVLRATSTDNNGVSTSSEITISLFGSSFAANPKMGVAPLTVNFTDQSTIDPTSWQWDFGDGESSTEQSPTHTYDEMGQYDVILTTSNGQITDTETKTSFIIVKGTITDSRDDQTYKIVEIGTQTWLAENLNFETPDSWWYNDDPANGDLYGRLYTWDAAMQACPAGWHLSSDDEWKSLEMYLGMSQDKVDNENLRGTDEGRKLKSTSGWNTNDGLDAVGFTALACGYRSRLSGQSQYKGSLTYWWTSTVAGSGGAWYHYLDDGADKVGRYRYHKDDGYSVRCIKD